MLNPEYLQRYRFFAFNWDFVEGRKFQIQQLARSQLACIWGNGVEAAIMYSTLEATQNKGQIIKVPVREKKQKKNVN